MSTRFEVEPGQLAGLAGDLTQAVNAMRSARQAMEAASGRSIGVDALDSACGTFHDKWGYGLKQLGSTSEALATGLSETAQAYLAVDAAIVASMGGGSAHVMRPVSHGGGGVVMHGAPVKSLLEPTAAGGGDSGGTMKGVGDQTPLFHPVVETPDPLPGPVSDPRELWGVQ